MTEKSLHIIIADDHPLFRASLEQVLLNMRPNNQKPSILQAQNGHETLDILKQRTDIDLILTDLDMPDMNGLVLLQQIQVILPNTPVVIISGSEKHTDVQQALSMGAKGFIPKSSPTPILLAALQLTLAGGTYLPPLLLQSSPTDFTQADSIVPQAYSTLTERQKEILFFLHKGMQNKAIAHTLDLSEATVKVHVRGVFSVLGVKNRTQAVQKALELGVL